MSLGENVKFLRERRELTYDAVGAAVGTDGQNIFNLEKRKSKVSKFAPALAKFFGVDLHALMSEDLASTFKVDTDMPLRMVPARHTKSEIGSTGDDEPTFDDTMELLALFQRASHRERENILDLARSIRERNSLRWVRSADD